MNKTKNKQKKETKTQKVLLVLSPQKEKTFKNTGSATYRQVVEMDS